MGVKQVTSIMRIMGVLIIISMVHSCGSASENSPPAQMSDMRFGSLGNITEENFAEIQTSILDSINEQITELQNFHTNVSEASDTNELKKALASHRPAHAFMRHAGMDMGLCQDGFNLDSITSVTGENFTDVQTQIVGSLSDKSNMLKTELNDTRFSQDNNRTAEINVKITDIQNLSAEISEASNASELKEVMFTSMQTQTVDSIEKEIERLQTIIGENENTSANMTELSNRITELTTLKEKISDASSFDDLKTIISSSQISSRGIPGMKDDMMKHGRRHRFECQMNGPENMDDIN